MDLSNQIHNQERKEEENLEKFFFFKNASNHILFLYIFYLASNIPEKTTPEQKTVVSENTIPAGFFDNPEEDAKARQVDFKKKKKEDMQ